MITAEITAQIAGVTCRQQNEATDSDFLFTLYCGTRAEEMTAWGWPLEQQKNFLRFQYNAQKIGYTASMPQAEYRIACQDGRPIGRLVIDRSGDNLCLADIALLPEHRGRGIGSYLLQTLKEEAATTQRRITLHVRQDNPAQRLYKRAGFRIVGAVAPDYRMEWSPLPM